MNIAKDSMVPILARVIYVAVILSDDYSNEALNFFVPMEERTFWQNSDMYNTVSNYGIDFTVDLFF